MLLSFYPLFTHIIQQVGKILNTTEESIYVNVDPAVLKMMQSTEKVNTFTARHQGWDIRVFVISWISSPAGMCAQTACMTGWYHGLCSLSHSAGNPQHPECAMDHSWRKCWLLSTKSEFVDRRHQPKPVNAGLLHKLCI